MTNKGLSQGKLMNRSIARWLVSMFTHLRALGPYLAIELIMPGGSLLALGLWLYRHRQNRAAA
jgi:hypothetical protein